MCALTPPQILEIRDRLNVLPFRDANRRVAIGRISERCYPTDEAANCGDEQGGSEEKVQAAQAAMDEYLDGLRTCLHGHGLELVRGEDDPDQLYAVQRLRSSAAVDLSWMSSAMTWAYRIMAIALEMVLPAIIGAWLDSNFGTRFMTVLGICLGLPLGMWHLIQITRVDKGPNAL